MKKSILLLFIMSALLFFSCLESETTEEEQMEELDLDSIISFGEWLYQAGSQPRLKYFIEKETDDDIVLEAIMTMYGDGNKLLGINIFNASLQQNINIDYFPIAPDNDGDVTKIELKDIYVNGEKTSGSKTFPVKLEN